jgi:hypothetical protein
MSNIPERVKVEEITVAVSINSNYLNRGWLTYYGLLMRQADNGEPSKSDVIKACKRVLEDLEVEL